MPGFGPWRKKRHPEHHPPQEVTLVTDLSHPQPHKDTDASPPETLPGPHFPDGVKVLHDCPDATVDICFVHGLTGDRESTWTADGQSAPWPKTLLPPRLKKARILTYGYDAYIVRASVASANRLNDHARNLLVKLTTNRELNHASSRALIFVAHSLGGLVCKEAILLSRNNPEPHLCDIFNCTKGVVFMGTPHKGTWMAKWASIPVSALGFVKSANKKLLEILDTKNEYLESIQSRFIEMLRQRQQQGKGSRPLKIACFLEEMPLPVAGMVVPKESAILDGFTYATIHSNHRNMVKFATAEEDGFQLLLGELVRWASQAGQILSETAQKCLKSLAFPQMQSRSHGIDRAVTGTCEWLRQHETYRSWAASDRGLLWIKGKPGSGKSTLVKYSLDNHGAEGDAVVLSFFFHGRGDELQRIPLGLFRSLLHQALNQAPDALQDLIDVFETKNKQYGSLGRDWHWHEAELQPFLESFLRKVVLKRRSVWLFIDALDESGKDDAVRLVEIFQSLLQRLPSQSGTAPGQVHICFSCRHYPVLDLDEGGFEICAEDENQRDIATFVDDQLAAFRAQSSTIPTLITERASGVFMWARLVVKQVLDLNREGAGLKKIQAAVHSVPPDLDALYQQLIQGMGPASLKLIQWICFATEPLTLDELRWAMVIEGDCPHRSLKACQSDEDYVPDSVRMKRQVQTLSRGLVEVSQPDYVQPIHQSVKDFFLEKGLSALDGSKTSTEAALRAHFRLAKICIRYLAMEEIGQSRLSMWGVPFIVLGDAERFLRYATNSWVAHIQQCDDKSIPQQDLLALFTWPSNALMERLARNYSAARYPGYRESVPKGTSLVHITSTYGLLGLLTAILERTGPITTYIDARDGIGRTPLSCAAQEGREGVVKLLLGTGKVDADTKCNAGRTPLSRAAQTGQEAVVKLLLSTGKVDADMKDNEGKTPLAWAAQEGHNAVAELLLGTGKTDADTRDEDDRTPLSWAAEGGHKALVDLLLGTSKVGADTKDNRGQTPLSWAAGKGHEAVVELLLSTGKVDADTKDNDGWTPLSSAAEEGHEAVVELLLGTGKVDANTKDNHGQTPLLRAAKEGHEVVVELLLGTNKVDIEARDIFYHQTPLSWAAGEGREAVVKVLLQTGTIDVETRCGAFGQTPLSHAARNGHTAVVKLLLSIGKADADSRDKFRATPLSWAAESGHEAVVKILLGISQVDADSKDRDGMTPLSLAAAWGQEAIVTLLLSIGEVDADSKDDVGRTPLLWAADGGHEAVVKLLLATGKVDLEAEDGVYHRTPWAWASENGHADVLELLEPAT